MAHRNSWFTYQNHGDFPVRKLLVFHISNNKQWWKNFCWWTNINAWYLCYLKFRYGDLFTHISSGLSWWWTNWWGKNNWAWKGSFKDMNFYMIWVKIVFFSQEKWLIKNWFPRRFPLFKKVVSTPKPLLDPNFPIEAINRVPHSLKQSYGGELVTCSGEPQVEGYPPVSPTHGGFHFGISVGIFRQIMELWPREARNLYKKRPSQVEIWVCLKMLG